MNCFERGVHYGIYDACQRFEVGIGTVMISPADAEVSVYKALKNGYRLSDTATPDEATEEKYASMQIAFDA